MTQHQDERHEEVFGTIEKTPRAKTCEAMSGIVSEMEEDLEDFGGTSAGDAVLIGCAQALEHYEIARYGMLRTWANALGNASAAKLLGETLAEEEATDKKLTSLATRLNKQAA
jgi:ferritin-like metal-binding protein YciE